jgi:hypothetical protein
MCYYWATKENLLTNGNYLVCAKRTVLLIQTLGSKEVPHAILLITVIHREWPLIYGTQFQFLWADQSRDIVPNKN